MSSIEKQKLQKLGLVKSATSPGSPASPKKKTLKNSPSNKSGESCKTIVSYVKREVTSPPETERIDKPSVAPLSDRHEELLRKVQSSETAPEFKNIEEARMIDSKRRSIEHISIQHRSRSKPISKHSPSKKSSTKVDKSSKGVKGLSEVQDHIETQKILEENSLGVSLNE